MIDSPEHVAGTAPRTNADLRKLFGNGFSRAIGTTATQSYRRLDAVRTLARKLEAHFDAIGWPSSEEEALTYVRQAIDKYC